MEEQGVSLLDDINALERKLRDEPTYTPTMFVGSVHSCATYGRLVFKWTDEQVADWYVRNGYDPETKEPTWNK